MPTVIFPLKLHKTYYERGFFNVTVEYDKFVRSTEGTVDIVLSGNKHITGNINRSANKNGTARIMGGVQLRNWFQENFQVNDTIEVDLTLPDVIRLMK
ncbi:MAG: hypothetical protein ACREBU_25265 [Nitrososphaera sp.]